MIRTYVFDANALLDLVDGGAGAHRVRDLLREAVHQRSVIMISVLNWGEVFYHLWQKLGEQQAHRVLGNLSRLPLQLMPVDLSQSLKAGEIKALHKIPYVDCIAAAVAEFHHAILVTSDRDFEKLGRRVHILWLARP
jgi:predicted nucleic acid-binding protein